MAEDCPSYQNGKCALAPAGHEAQCSWPVSGYGQCFVYKSSFPAGGGNVKDQPRPVDAPAPEKPVESSGRPPAGPTPVPPLILQAPDQVYTVRVTEEQGPAKPAPVPPPPVQAPILVAGEIKACPTCGQKLDASDLVCNACGAMFEVYTRAQCANCHKSVHVTWDGKCPECKGREFTDAHIQSTLIVPGEKPGT